MVASKLHGPISLYTVCLVCFANFARVHFDNLLDDNIKCIYKHFTVSGKNVAAPNPD